MKTLALYCLSLFLILTAQSQNNLGARQTSKVETELNKPQVLHTMDTWQLIAIKGVNKMELVIDAIKYNPTKSTEELKGIRIKLIPENLSSENDVTKLMSQYESYIDNSDYAELMVVLNQMIGDFTKRKQSEKHGIVNYTTKTGIKFGYIFTTKKEAGYISIPYDNLDISCEFASIEKFLNDLRNYIDIASKDLYLPENAEKLKNAKKSNQEVKDVIIDDI